MSYMYPSFEYLYLVIDDCTEVPGLYTCDSNGTIVCVNASCDPESQCMMCNATEPGMLNDISYMYPSFEYLYFIIDGCTEVPGLYTCDSNGTIVCVNASCDPDSECMMCNTTEPGMLNDISYPFLSIYISS